MNTKALSFRLFFSLMVILLVLNTAWGANLKVHIINVGQGDCELIVSPTGKTVLIDAGNNGKGNSVVIPYLNSKGITDLDYIVASHYHADHIGGIDEVVDGLGGISYIITAVYDRGGSYGTQTYTDYKNAVSLKRTTITPGQVINLGGGATLTCIAVGGKTVNQTVNLSSTDENNRSVMLKLDYYDFQMCLGGDCANKMEAVTAALVGDVDVYKVNHHGADDASTQSFLNVLIPEVSTIPVGTNSYDHPRSSVHTRLVNIGSYIYQTETGNRAPPAGYGEVANGSFKIETDGFSYTISGSSLQTAAYQTDCSHYCDGSHIVFSEVLYDSEIVYETEGEWIELYNPTTLSVNISGWTIEDNINSYTIPSGTTIGSKNYLVIADGSTEFKKKYGCNPHLSDLTLRLNNDGDYLTLKNSSGDVVDQAAWEDGGSYVSGWGSTSLPAADEGKSIIRADVNQDTDTYADWLSNQNPDPGVDCPPEITLSLTGIDFQTCAGTTPDSQTFSVSNSGGGTLNWWATDNVNWLSCSPTSGTNSGEVTVSVDTSGLVVGTYTAAVTVSDTNATNSPQTVTVTFTIIDCEKPWIALSTNQIDFEASAGTVPDPQTFSISNAGGGMLNWWAADNVNWLDCSPTSGTNSGEVTVSVDTSGLAVGTHTGTVTINDTNAPNSPQTVIVTLEILEPPCPPEISLNRMQLNFGASGGIVTGPQTILIGNSGCGILNWSVNDNALWLNCTPTSGVNAGVITVSVNSSGLALGTYTGIITISNANVSNSPQSVTVTLNIYSTDVSPFGSFDTPADSAVVCSSIPVTGWVLDDVEVESVKIYRQAESTLAYIGDAVFVEGARPDVEMAYPGYPLNYRAGWGYMMLTNSLPGGGNGNYVLVVKAFDGAGHEITLDTKTITCDNLNAHKPFGAIDTPTQGGTASGSSFINWGWVLTPQPNYIPPDGSTINVWVDGVNIGHPTYNIYRADIATLFPGYANSTGAIGYFYLDTTPYENGVHTIQWTAKDSAGNTDGIGSRFFTIRNSSQDAPHSAARRAETFNVQRSMFNVNPVVNDSRLVWIKKGYNPNIEPQTSYPDENEIIFIEIKELERLEINLGQPGWIGYQIINDRLRKLPIGSTLNNEKNIFYWQPGPGFIGEYKFVFIENHIKRRVKKNICVRILPRF